MGDEVLQPLVRAGIAQATVHRLHRLPFAVVQQPLQIATGVLAMGLPTETADEPIQKGPQPFQQRSRRWIGHASEDTEFGRSVQVKITK
jgi:hypothetical protein